MTRALPIFYLLVLLAADLFSQQPDSPVLIGPFLGQKLPGVTPEIFAPGIISQTGNHLHSCVSFSPDGTEIYFTYMVFDSVGQGTIHYLKRVGDEWTRRQVAPFSGVYSDDSPTFSPDGNRLFFSSTRPVNESDSTVDQNFWYVDRTDSGWSEPVYAGDVLNSGYCDFRLSISQRGTVYLSSDRNDIDHRTFDIFESELVDGQYSSPRVMDVAITTPVTEQIGLIAPDERYIVFFRYSRANPDSMGLYVSFRRRDDTWTEGKNMGGLFNSPAKSCTQAASLSPDGKYLFFLRRYDEAIYWVDTKVIEDLKPNPTQ